MLVAYRPFHIHPWGAIFCTSTPALAIKDMVNIIYCYTWMEQLIGSQFPGQWEILYDFHIFRRKVDL